MELPQSTDELRALIRKHGPDAVARRFRKPPVPSQLLRAISEENPPEEVYAFLTAYALTPSSLLEDIGAHHADYPAAVLIPLAQNPRTPPGTLSQLLQHDDDHVRAAVVSNPNVPTRDIDALLSTPNPIIWRAIASNPAIKFKIQAILAARGDASVRLELVQSKSLHPDLLIAMSADPSLLVRHTLAATTKASDDTLLFWADSDREEIQLALLSRSTLPTDVWRSLLLSPHARVRAIARNHSKLDETELLHLSRSPEPEDRRFVASQPELAAGIQHQLVQDPEKSVRVTLAENTSIWPELSEFMVTSEDVSACLALLDNAAMPEALYLELVWMNDPTVTAALATHEQTPVDILQFLTNERLSATALAHMAIAQRPANWLRGELADALAHHELPSVRALAATSQNLSATALHKLKDDPVPRVRNLAYEFPPADEPTTPQLSSDAVMRCLAELTAIINGDTPTTEKPSKQL